MRDEKNGVVVARRRAMACLALGTTAVFGLAMTQLGGYASDYEGVVADADGEILTAQDGYYIPSGTTSVDFLAYTYAGNTLGLVANPDGGDQFVGGIGPATGGNTFARAQRDITWGTGQWRMTYDVCATFQGTLPAAQNLGSVSVQPYPGSASFIQLDQWVDINTAANWNATYLMYNAGGTVDAQPGQSPGPAWAGLLVNNWYRMSVLIDYDQNRVLEVSISDVTGGGATTTVDVSALEYYMQGGSAGGFPIPTGFRYFAGSGTVPGNSLAFDNFEVAPEVSGPLCPDATAWVNSSSDNGNAAGVCGSDDSRYTARRSTFTPATTLFLRNEADFTSAPLGGPTSLVVSAEVSIDNAAVGNVRARVVLRNQVGGSDKTVLSGFLSTTDVVVTLSETVNPADFIGPNGEIQVHVVYVQTAGGPNWQGRIDDLTVDVQ